MFWLINENNNFHLYWPNLVFHKRMFQVKVGSNKILDKVNLKNIFVSPYPTLFYWCNGQFFPQSVFSPGKECGKKLTGGKFRPVTPV